MKWAQLTMASARALSRHKLRSILSVLGIVFAVVAMVAMLSIAEGAKRDIMAQIRSLGTDVFFVRPAAINREDREAGRHGLSKGLSRADAASALRLAPMLSAAAPLQEIKARVAESLDKKPFEVLAVDEEYALVRGLRLLEGRFISRLDVASRRPVCVLGFNASRSLAGLGKVGGRLLVGGRPCKVVGVLAPGRTGASSGTVLAARDYNQAVFLPLGLIWQSGLGLNGVSEILFKARPGVNLDAAARAVERVLEVRHYGEEDFRVMVPHQLLAQAAKSRRVFNMVLGGVAGISLLVGGIGIMNMMLAGVNERTREIGIRRAIGAGRGHIAFQFLCEAVLLTAAGGLAGCLVGGAAAHIIGSLAGWPTVVTVWSLLLAMVMALGVGIVSGLHPALAAARIVPVEALRHEA